MMFRGRIMLPLGGLSLLFSACQFRASASATGDAKTGADAQGSWQGAVQPPLQPAVPAQPPAERAIHFEAGRLAYKGVINFEYDKDNLMTDEVTKKTLSEFKEYLQRFPEVHLEIEGHTDSRGSDDYNRDLSNRRAATVKSWLVDNGIDPSRLSSVGKGEDQPQIPEPYGCKDEHPEDTKPCEDLWAKNRRVVFEVTKGADVLQKAEAAPPPIAAAPPPPPPPPPPAIDPGCPWLWGGHLNAAGPNSWVTAAAATQPGICWLELSLGLGVGFGFEAAEAAAAGVEADGSYVSLTVPLRGRFWFMDRHSLIGDLGVGITHYRITSNAEDDMGNGFEYTRNTTPFIAHAGLGYGFRPNGSEAGFRLALVIGGLLHLTELGDSSVDAAAGFPAATATALQNALDDDSDELREIEPYAEVSFGLLF